MTAALTLLLLSVLGAMDAAYLTYAHLFGAEACGAGSGCGEVMGSPYSKMMGIPLSTFGLGLYLAIVFTAWRALRREDRADAMHTALILAAVGAVPSLFLVYQQAIVIEAWCPFCLLSVLITLVLLGVAWSARRDHHVGDARRLWISRESIPVGLAIVVPPLLYVPLEDAVHHTRSYQSAPAEVVARIGDREITRVEMDDAIRVKLHEVRAELRQDWLDRQVLEAKAEEEGLSARALVNREVRGKVEITAEEIDRRWGQIRHRLKPGTTLTEVESTIRHELRQLKSEPALKAYVARLKKHYDTFYIPPLSERFAFDPNPRNGPEKGAANAPVTIVEFSDLECSFCAGAHAHLSELVKRRPGDVRLIFRHYPLERHRHARFAAEVAACAHQQGMFWDVADRLFGKQDHLNEATIRQHAEEVGVDVTLLGACLESGAGARVVAEDMEEGDALGVDSTPTFFVNGHYIGSMPSGGMESLIDREIQR